MDTTIGQWAPDRLLRFIQNVLNTPPSLPKSLAMEKLTASDTLSVANKITLSPQAALTIARSLPAGISTQTPGAVSTVTIPHGQAVVPRSVQITPASATARGAPLFYISLDSTNITLNFASALTAATSYSWAWLAV